MNEVKIEQEQELLSLEEAAEFLFVSKSTLYRLLDQSKLRGMKAGKQWRFRREDLLAYMQRGPAAQALSNIPIAILDNELAFFAEELSRAGSSSEEADDPALEGEAGKITQLARRMIWLMRVANASDLNLEPVWNAGAEQVLIRMRTEGKLDEIHRLPASLQESLLLEWMRVAGLPIEKRPRPQDGNARFTFDRNIVHLLIAIAPTFYGEKVAIRMILTKAPTLEQLGLEHTPLRDWMRLRKGMILFAGPTGSGKSTTYAACIKEIIPCGEHIIAVEDPVIYLFEQGVTYIKVENFSCADGIRAARKQDPDVIIIGELQGDPEVAQLAIAAAETGHLVMTCIHADDAISPLYEFLEWGVKRSLLTANINGIVNQHLLSKLCPVCKTPHSPDPELLTEICKAAEEGGYHVPKSAEFYQSTGCDACQGKGFLRSRFVVHEYFTFTPALKAAFLRGVSQDEFTKLARESRQLSSFAAGIKKIVEEGSASLDEVMRKIPHWRT